MCIKTIDKTLYIHIQYLCTHMRMFSFPKNVSNYKKKNKFFTAYINQLPNTNLSQKKKYCNILILFHNTIIITLVALTLLLIPLPSAQN